MTASWLFVKGVQILRTLGVVGSVSRIVPSAARAKLMRYFKTTDMTGYETLIEFMQSRKLLLLEGNIIEIGAFLGGGTAKLARFCSQSGKKVYAVDTFDLYSDTSALATGVRQSTYYENVVKSFGGKTQREIYDEAVKGLGNVVTIASDSKLVRLPVGERLVFGFVDGNHQREYVVHDFYLVWDRLVQGGAIAFDDYRNADVPSLTASVDFLIRKHRAEIREVVHFRQKRIIVLVKG